ncbi:MAG: histidinol-phosphatase [Deltaproteobacteria bacterium]|nr:histidinol-phosphatase [Deltaproteobacteria bacterium]MBW2400666.1 histidinol-phosphatase [Deltaproteobacteria bacterium]MBW2667779.1 histidinol-phosphatase [Deltaproteobacteria bacterium]
MTALLWLLWPFEKDLPWWKGNLHTHSLWSDGDQFPEMITDWYKQRGYHFLAMSDHRVLAEGEKWFEVPNDLEMQNALARYEDRFGSDWVSAEVGDDGVARLRLKTLEEYRGLFEEKDRFLILQAEEITAFFAGMPLHVNATNIRELIPARNGENVLEVLQKNVDAVLEQRVRSGQPMFPHVPHPNFRWLVTADDLIALDGDRFFEVYNGHPLANNDGDGSHPSSERIWDTVLTKRLLAGKDAVFALAVDDAHQYHVEGRHQANPGRGWIMVRATQLTPESIIAAMEAGDFYASTGVELSSLEQRDGAIELAIRAEKGVSYSTQFIGTRRGRSSGRGIGTVLAEQHGTSARYELSGDEIYVRAKIVSSKQKPNPYRLGEREVAWTQPLLARIIHEGP